MNRLIDAVPYLLFACLAAVVFAVAIFVNTSPIFQHN